MGGTCEYEDVFGADWNCDEGSGIQEIACYGNIADVVDMSDTWELRRAQDFAKLGRGPDLSTLLSGEFRDLFDVSTFNNNDGALSWTGPWIESDTAGVGPTVGNPRIGAELVFDWTAVGDDLAATFDAEFYLREKFLLVLADGENTCSGPSACGGTIVPKYDTIVS